jgi:hypothetical protein
MAKGLGSVIQKAREEIAALIGCEVVRVTSVKEEPDGWRLTLEVLEMKSIPTKMDILGLYEVLMDADQGLVSYDRSGMRRRGDVEGNNER